MKAEDKLRIMEKVKKLLALAGSDNDNEAEAAMRMAGEIMAKYGIEEGEVQGDLGKEVPEWLDFNIYDKASWKWEGWLLVSICKVFDCKCIFMKYEDKYKVVGFKHDLELAKWFFSYLRTVTIKKAEAKHANKKSRIDYCLGFTESVTCRIKVMFTARQEAMTTDCTALVLVKNQDVLKEFNDKFPTTKKTKNRSRVSDAGAYFGGREDGKAVGLNRPLGGGSSRANGPTAIGG